MIRVKPWTIKWIYAPLRPLISNSAMKSGFGKMQPIGSYASVDFFGQLHHQTHQDVPTNLYLPSVLYAYRNYVVKQGEITSLLGGVGVHLQVNTMYRFGLSGKIGNSSYQYIEHLYQVDLKPTLNWRSTLILHTAIETVRFNSLHFSLVSV